MSDNMKPGMTWEDFGRLADRWKGWAIGLATFCAAIATVYGQCGASHSPPVVVVQSQDPEQVKWRKEYEEKNKPRTLQSDQVKRIAGALRSAPPRTVDLSIFMGDGEALGLASQIKDALEQGGWKVNGIIHMIADKPYVGIKVSAGVKTEAEYMGLAGALYTSIAKEGLRVQPLGATDYDPGRISILVGTKPQ